VAYPITYPTTDPTH